MNVKADKLVFAVLGAVGLIIVLTVLQDLLHARTNGYAFYLSESLVYKIPWIIFLPTIFLTYSLLKKYRKLFNRLAIGSAYVLGITLVHLALSSFLIEVIARHLLDTPYVVRRIFKNLVAGEFYVFLLIYAILYASIRYLITQQQQKSTAAAASKPGKLSLKQGRKTVVLEVDKIDWIKSNSPYITICADGNKYLHSASLRQILEELDSDDFVRIHRSHVVNIQKVAELSSRLNGDYDVLMQSGDKLRLSRNYSKALKGRLL